MRAYRAVAPLLFFSLAALAGDPPDWAEEPDLFDGLTGVGTDRANPSHDGAVSFPDSTSLP